MELSMAWTLMSPAATNFFSISLARQLALVMNTKKALIIKYGLVILISIYKRQA
jgi:hypothetical protein